MPRVSNAPAYSSPPLSNTSFDVAEKVIEHFIPALEKMNFTIDVSNPDNVLHRDDEKINHVSAEVAFQWLVPLEAFWSVVLVFVFLKYNSHLCANWIV